MSTDISDKIFSRLEAALDAAKYEKKSSSTLLKIKKLISQGKKDHDQVTMQMSISISFLKFYLLLFEGNFEPWIFSLHGGW